MKWINTNNRFIAFFDIMGFKNMVATIPHEELIEKVEGLANFTKFISRTDFSKNSIVKTAIFSDSVIFISNDDTLDSAIHIIIASSIFVEKSIELNIPLKGCIAYGKFTADFEKSLFIGQPLIDAYLLQEELFMYSVVMHHTFETFINNKEYGGQKFPENERLIKYLTPLKSGKVWHYHLNWKYYTVGNLEKKVIYENYIKKFYNTVSGKTRGYVDNTVDFFEKMTNDIRF